MSNSPNRRQNRSRSRRDVPKTDAIAIALTAQVIACAALLLMAVVMKRTNEERYNQISGEYIVLATSPVDSAELLEEISQAGGGLQGIFASLESFIAGMVDRFVGGGQPQAQAIPEADPEEEPPVPEDAQDVEGAFDYNYLDATEVMYTGLGQGGAYPVDTMDLAGGRGDTALPAPEGATFAAVELLGNAVPPITGLITSEFSFRAHPVNGDEDFHTGMDIAAEEGRDILAVLPGEVVEVGESEIYGNYIILQHATNLRTFYAHCSEILAQKGAAVRQGERIAKVGSTGLVTGPHLHFSVIVEGQFTDPYWILKDNIKLVD